jgi:HSP20 family protein
MVRYRIYPINSLVHPLRQSHSHLRQEPTAAPLHYNSHEHPGENPAPPLDVKEDADAYYVELEIPGVAREKVTLSLLGNVLTIKGNKARKAPGDAVHTRCRERQFGEFSCEVPLPHTVESDAVKARLENGLLMVTLPKQESSKPRHIPIGNSIRSVESSLNVIPANAGISKT